jgi:hypothetical protein
LSELRDATSNNNSRKKFHATIANWGHDLQMRKGFVLQRSKESVTRLLGGYPARRIGQA